MGNYLRIKDANIQVNTGGHSSWRQPLRPRKVTHALIQERGKMSLIAFLDLLQLPIIAGNDPAADRRTTAAELSDKNTLPPENPHSRKVI